MSGNNEGPLREDEIRVMSNGCPDILPAEDQELIKSSDL